MISNKKARATSNLLLLEIAAKKLGSLNENVVYLGGCTTALFIDDPISPDIRATIDVDCIIDVISLMEYYQFEERLVKHGFEKSIEDDIICRWRNGKVILDVIPADERILGFGNLWYKKAVKHSVEWKLTSGLKIKSVSAPYFLGTKLEAFKARGNNDLLGSHDYEDIISVIAGRTDLVEEIAFSDLELKKYLKEKFEELLQNDQFEQTLPGHINEGPATMQRVQVVIERIRKIIMLANGN